MKTGIPNFLFDQISPTSLALASTALLLLVLLGNFNYLLFHTVAEIFEIVVACGVFMFVWSARRFMEDRSLLLLGMAYLFVAGLELFHTLSFPGVGIIGGVTANEPLQLWIAAIGCWKLWRC